jgi:hypothetical protein
MRYGDAMADIDDLFTPPNAAAYEKQELRKGVPLSYVGEKLRSSLYYLHGLRTTIREVVPDDSTVPSPVETEHRSTKEERLVGPADMAFYYALVSFLALYNSLGRLGEWGKEEEKIRALKWLHRTEFEAWLDSVASEGSVTG